MAIQLPVVVVELLVIQAVDKLKVLPLQGVMQVLVVGELLVVVDLLVVEKLVVMLPLEAGLPLQVAMLPQVVVLPLQVAMLPLEAGLPQQVVVLLLQVVVLHLMVLEVPGVEEDFNSKPLLTTNTITCNSSKLKPTFGTRKNLY